MSDFWNKFYNKPLDKIPWQNTQADWFKELVDSGKIKGKTALELGCGTGMKSLYLARHTDFEQILGVDISTKAISYAKENTELAGLEYKCTFISTDVANWNLVKENQEFDFILDWALIHCLDPQNYPNYIEGINQHLKSGGLFLVRSFSSKNNENYFVEKVDGQKSKIYFLNETSLIAMFNDFEMIDKNISYPRTKVDFYFTEILFKKKN